MSCLSGIAGGLDQQDLKEAVVENNIVQLNHPADRKGVEDTAEDVTAGIVGSVEKDSGIKGADAAHRLKAGQDVGEMTQGLFQAASCRIGSFGKSAKTGDIAEVVGNLVGTVRRDALGKVPADQGAAPMDTADVDRERDTRQDTLCRLPGV